jgi:hypothetical protein
MSTVLWAGGGTTWRESTTSEFNMSQNFFERIQMRVPPKYIGAVSDVTASQIGSDGTNTMLRSMSRAAEANARVTCTVSRYILSFFGISTSETVRFTL